MHGLELLVWHEADALLGRARLAGQHQHRLRAGDRSRISKHIYAERPGVGFAKLPAATLSEGYRIHYDGCTKMMHT